MEQLSKSKIMRFITALAICLGLGIMVCLASVLPCSYHDAVDGKYAGYGYHSFFKAASEGLEWNTSLIPEQSPLYSGTGPYVVSAEYWIVLLYIPIFIAIIFLGLAMVKHPISAFRKSQ